MSDERAEKSLLVSIPSAARFLGVGAKVVRDAVKNGQIASVEIGRRQLVPRAEIERLSSGGSQATLEEK